jgi:hypothetical protein
MERPIYVSEPARATESFTLVNPPCIDTEVILDITGIIEIVIENPQE